MVRAFLVVKDVAGRLLFLTEARMNTRYIAWAAGIGGGGGVRLFGFLILPLAPHKNVLQLILREYFMVRFRY